jgi:hypothetical protein
VFLDGAGGNHEPAGDAAVVQALPDELKYFVFAGGDADATQPFGKGCRVPASSRHRAARAAEHATGPRGGGRLAFARQKVAEVVLLSRALHEGRDAVAGLAVTAGKRGRVARDDRVRARLDALGPDYYRPRPRAACRSGCSA